MRGPVEFWKNHPDDARIEVSSFGRVRSAKGHYYKNYRDTGGYLRVTFNMNGKHTTKRVHRLVAQTFIPNLNNLPEVNHKDGDTTNNNVSNLEFCTASYNSQYRDKFGISNTESRGHPVFAINLATLEEYRFRSQGEASRMLRFSVSNINNVIMGKQKQTHGYWFANVDSVPLDWEKVHFEGAE